MIGHQIDNLSLCLTLVIVVVAVAASYLPINFTRCVDSVDGAPTAHWPLLKLLLLLSLFKTALEGVLLLLVL